MSHYLIFIPNKQAANPQNLRDAGLGDLLVDGDITPMCCDLIGAGPSGQIGQVWAWGNSIPAYLPDRQTWTEEKQKRYWVGVDNANPPKPDDLLRKEPIAGLIQQLSDGNYWVIPNVAKLPMGFDEDENGELIMVPLDPYAGFVEESKWAFQACLDVVSGRDIVHDWKRCLRFVVAALSLNYRLNLQLAVQLGLLSESILYTCMAKVVDTQAIYEAMQR